jgi:hypothetical protein
MTDQNAGDAPVSRIKKLTLGELGNRMPLGIPQADGTFSKEIESMAWKTKHERAIGALKKEGMNMAQHASIILTQLYTQVGPLAWTPETKHGEKLLALGRMYLPDVLYMYVLLRSKVISDRLKMDLACPTCRHKFLFNGAMSSIEVNTLEKVSDLDWYFPLQDPISIRKKTVTKFRMNPPKWFQLESSVASANAESAKIMICKACIVGLNDEMDVTQIGDSEMDEVSKRDLERMQNEINQDFLGPKMSIEGDCPACNRQFALPINWRDDAFFSESSP